MKKDWMHFSVHGEISYLEGENLNVTAAITLNNYKTSSQYRAWGMLPFEFTTSFQLADHERSLAKSRSLGF